MVTAFKLHENFKKTWRNTRCLFQKLVFPEPLKGDKEMALFGKREIEIVCETYAFFFFLI